MSGEVDDWLLPRQGTDAAQRIAGRLFVWGHAVDCPLEHQRLVVGSVTGQEVRHSIRAHDDGDMPCGMPRRRHDDDIACCREREAVVEGATVGGMSFSGKDLVKIVP